MKRNNRTETEQGFGLIEVMIAMLVFLVVSLGICKTQIAAILHQKGTMYRDEALRLAEDELQYLQSQPFSEDGTSSDLDETLWSSGSPDWTAVDDDNILTVSMRSGHADFYRSVQITDIATSPVAMKRVDVAIGWSQDTKGASSTPINHQTSLSTILVEN